MLERGVQHLVCSFSLNNFSRLVEVPFRTQTVQSGTCEMWKSVSRRMSTTKLISYPDLLDMSANPNIFSFRMNWNNCLQVLFFWENKFGTKCWERTFGSQTWTKVNRKLHTGERSEPIFGKSYWRSQREKFEPVKSCFPLSFFRVFFWKRSGKIIFDFIEPRL